MLREKGLESDFELPLRRPSNQNLASQLKLQAIVSEEKFTNNLNNDFDKDTSQNDRYAKCQHKIIRIESSCM